MDPRYNLSRIVEQSVAQGTPMIAASINYRLAYWGFMFSREMEAAGAGNLAFRDQRMALEWLRDHVGSFGGSSERVTVWGESAGARSLGMQLVAYEGDHQNLFQRAILESGSPVANFATSAKWQPWFDALVDKTGCAGSSDKLQCLRQLPVQALNDIFNSTTALPVSAPALSAVIDGDFMTDKGADLLRNGKFAKVPLLVGNNFDEGTQYGSKGINTTAQFLDYVKSTGVSDALAEAIAVQYPDDPAKGIPATLDGRPSAYPWGLQWKRVAAYAGDIQQHSGRRLLAETYAGAGVPVYSYRFNVLVNGMAVEEGAKHFQEVAFVFDNTEGQGYAVNPFEGEPRSFVELADLMSRMWVAFVSSGNPNVRRSESTTAKQRRARRYSADKSGTDTTCLKWPRYQLDNPRNIVFDVNTTQLTYLEPDNYRQEEIEFLLQNYYA